MSDYKKNIEKNKGAPVPWCVLPWSHISIKENGSYRVCCHSEASQGRGILKDKKGAQLHVKSASWKEAINNPAMKAIRKKMLAGKWPKECLRCQREHESGIKSRNIYERHYLAGIVEEKNYPNYAKAKDSTAPDGSISSADFPVSYPDIRFGNLCNLKCMMCSPVSSSKWYDDFHGVWGYDHFFYDKKKIKLIPDKKSPKKNGLKNSLKPEENIYGWYDDPSFWEQMERRMSEFRHIYIAGGEPLLIKSHYKFLRKCVQMGAAPKLNIQYNTNLTVIPEAALDIWRHFKNVLIGVSLDGFGAINDFIRFPSKWSKIEKNLARLSKIEGPFDLHITPTISSLNIWHLPEFIEYIMKQNYKRAAPWENKSVVSPHPVHRPHYLNVNILENEFKEKIKKRFDFYKKKFSAMDWRGACGESRGSASWEKKTNQICKILDNYIEYMYNIQYKERDLIIQRSNFIHFMDRLDELRKTSWPKILPELYEHTMKWRKLPKGLY